MSLAAQFVSWHQSRNKIYVCLSVLSLETQAAGFSWTLMSICQTCHFPEDSNINIGH